jgi:hypothetical protein
MHHLDQTRSALRQILLQDWDPHNAAREPAAHGTYDTYLAPLHDLIASGADEQSVMDWLHDREKETMCFPSLGKERLRRVARKLIRAVAHHQ